MLVYFCLISAAGLLTDFGWQTTPSGELEYILQIEPELLKSLRDGEEIVSEVPADLSGVRRIRLRVGNGPLPHGEAEAVPVADPIGGGGTFQPPAPPHNTNSPSREPPGSQPLDDEPPPLLPQNTAFQPPATAPSNTPIPGAFNPPNAPADNVTLPPGGAFPIQPSDEQTLQPIPRDNTVAPQGASISDRFPDRLDDQVRPATASQPVETTRSKTPSKTAPPPSKRTTRKPAQDTSPTSRDAESRPWMPLFLTSLLLFASIGLNVYLGWIAWGAMQRYRALAQEVATT